MLNQALKKVTAASTIIDQYTGELYFEKGKKYKVLSWVVYKTRRDGWQVEYTGSLKIDGVYGLWPINVFTEYAGQKEIIIDLSNRNQFKNRFSRE